MANDVIGEVTDKTKEKLRDFDEQEAYSLLLEIFSNAQATKDYAKFQSELANWKQRYPIDLFSDDLKRKIKYMLSNEFLNKVLEDYVAFNELSKKDPSIGLEKLRKVLGNAEKHKDSNKLNKALDKLYAEYPLNFLKEKYPHIVPMLVSKAHIGKILEKFDSKDAFKELDSIIQEPNSFKSAEEFKTALQEYQMLFPIAEFNDEYKPKVEALLSTFSDDKKLTELFPISEYDLGDGQVVLLETHTTVEKTEQDAKYDFFKIVNNDITDTSALFDWTCKYAKHINSFDKSTKSCIVETLMKKYYGELPTQDIYQLPEMKDLSESSPDDIEQFKKDTVLQLLGILSSDAIITKEDIYRLSNNSKQFEDMKKSAIDFALYEFMNEKMEDELNFDNETTMYLNGSISTSSGGGSSLSIPIPEDSSPKKEEVQGPSITSTNVSESESFPISILPNEMNSAQSPDDNISQNPPIVPQDTEIKPQNNEIDLSEGKKDSLINETTLQDDGIVSDISRFTGRGRSLDDDGR